MLHALDGGFIPAGSSGSPLRGLVNVLPTGRNFHTVDARAVPSRLAWEIGGAMADSLVQRYLEETGGHPESVGLSVWGTSAMRTSGDDVAEVLGPARCATGVGRGVSPSQRPAGDTPRGAGPSALRLQAGYGARILQVVESGSWRDERDLAEVYTARGGFAYGRAPTGSDPKACVGDSTTPDAVRTRTLQEETNRVFRARVVNPRWIGAMQRHGYKRAFDLAATVDYLFGFDATTGVVHDWRYAALAQE